MNSGLFYSQYLREQNIKIGKFTNSNLACAKIAKKLTGSLKIIKTLNVKENQLIQETKTEPEKNLIGFIEGVSYFKLAEETIR